MEFLKPREWHDLPAENHARHVEASRVVEEALVRRVHSSQAPIVGITSRVRRGDHLVSSAHGDRHLLGSQLNELEAKLAAHSHRGF